MSTAVILHHLQTGQLELDGVLPWSSNYAFLGRVCAESVELPVVYKPRRGERPLWDFAQGTLCLREQAAFLVSEALGWHIVPPTVLRKGQHGLGSVQLFIEHDPERHYFTFEGESIFRTQLQRIVLFDVLINNADRKSGHVLLQVDQAQVELEARHDDNPSQRLWGIDHGICFHTDPKLRTVIWEFAGTAVPPQLLAELDALRGQMRKKNSPLMDQLRDLLTQRELNALQQRLNTLIDRGDFPNPGPGRHYPWPPV